MQYVRNLRSSAIICGPFLCKLTDKMNSPPWVLMETHLHIIATPQDKSGEMIKDLENTAQIYGISEIYVFGSRMDEIARRISGEEVGSNFSTSDVDIGVESISGKRLTAKQKVQIAIQLEDLLKVSRVDLVVMSEVSPFLALEIINGRLLYCKDPDAQAEHELLILRRAGDLAYYERRRREAIMRGDF